MATTRLYIPHSPALTVLYADLESYAFQQPSVLVGTAGSVIERTNAKGFRFYAHKFYDAEGKAREKYIAGPVGEEPAERMAEDLRAQIRELKDIVPSLRMLAREGFCAVGARTYATLAALHNGGLFAAGAMLIGSHAYGVMLNRLGARAAPYATEDIDLARREALTFDKPPDTDLLGILEESGIDFVATPGLRRKDPATSYTKRGRSRFHVDLLAPSRGETYPIVAVPELSAHASGLPYLDYLLAESQPGMILARQGCCAVRVPLPERFAVHKLITSRLRTGRQAKSTKDIHQASVLFAVLANTHPGAIESAIAAIPRRAKKHFRAALPLALRTLENSAPQALEPLTAHSKH